jgi:hypothetical protein
MTTTQHKISNHKKGKNIIVHLKLYLHLYYKHLNNEFHRISLITGNTQI